MHSSPSSLWPKATQLDPEIKRSVAKGRNCPGRFSKKKKTLPARMLISPICREVLVLVFPRETKRTGNARGCSFMYLYQGIGSCDCGGLAKPKCAGWAGRPTAGPRQSPRGRWSLKAVGWQKFLFAGGGQSFSFFLLKKFLLKYS